MASSGKSRADENKAIRKKALREQLANGGHIQHVIDIADKLSNFDNTLEPTDIQRYKAAADIKLKLINKYLPDTKSIELSSDEDSPLSISVIERTIVKAKD